MCLTAEAFALFIYVTGLTYERDNRVFTLSSEQPAVWVYHDETQLFCLHEGEPT